MADSRPHLAILACGAHRPEGAWGGMIAGFERTIEHCWTGLLHPAAALEPFVADLLTAVFCRSLMESCAFAALARLDPLRPMVVHHVQTSSQFDVSKRSALALQWTGDVLSLGGAKPAVSQDTDPDKLDRALFSQAREMLNWIPAWQRLADLNATQSVESQWLGEMLGLLPEKVVPYLCGRLRSLYSIFSKLIHLELVANVPPVDPVTMAGNKMEAIKYSAMMALLTHFDPACMGCITPKQALTSYCGLEEAIGDA